MKNRFLTMLLTGALMALSLTACSSTKTSTTTFTTSVTDENGETTTHTTTTTTENGETTTEEETTATTDETEAAGSEEAASTDGTVPYEYDEDDLPTLRDEWSNYFEFGAEGTTEADETVLFTYDDPENMTQAALMIISADDILTLYDIGPVRMDGDYYVIEDLDGDVELPFLVSDTEDDHFRMNFQDDTYADLYYVDKDKIIDDMCSIIEQISAQN